MFYPQGGSKLRSKHLDRDSTVKKQKLAQTRVKQIRADVIIYVRIFIVVCKL